MSKLYFRYGAMGSSKTANALMVHYNFAEKGQTAILLKPSIENRDGETTIKSRIGIAAECQYVENFLKVVKNEWKIIHPLSDKASAIIVDEAQFLTSEQVDELSDIVDFMDIPVLCYGLRSDFQGHLFEGSKRLMEVADVIEEIPTVCWCGKRAGFNARISDGHIVRDGEQVMMGANESYVSLCRKHFKTGRLNK